MCSPVKPVLDREVQSHDVKYLRKEKRANPGVQDSSLLYT